MRRHVIQLNHTRTSGSTAKHAMAMRGLAIVFSMVLAVSAPLGLATLSTQEAYAEPTTAEQLEAAQQEAAEAETKLEELSAELNEASNALHDIQSEKSDVEDQIAKTQDSITETQARVDASIDDLNATVTTQYRSNANTLSTLASVLTSSSTLDEAVSGIFYSQRVQDQQQSSIDTYVSAKTELETKQADLEDQKADLEDLEDQAEAKESELSSAVSAQQDYYDGLSEEVQELMAQKEAEEAAAAQAAAEAAAAQAAAEAAAQAEAEAQATAEEDSDDTEEAASTETAISDDGDDDGDSSSSSSGSYSVGTYSSAVDAAASRIGCPYAWGASGPNSFDCSGLVMWAYAQVGVYLDHYSGSQYAACSYHFYDMSEAQPGDLVFYGSGGSSHVAIYAGGGTMIEAPHSGASVCYSSVRMGSNFAGFGRL